MNLRARLAEQTLLVVDDNDASRYATARILRAAGFRVLEAATGGAALAAAEQGIALIVLDVNLPDIDGFEVCRQLRAHGDTAYLPIVHLSATFVAPTDADQGLAAGADSYLTHPVEPAVLIATVRALLFAREADTLKRATDARFRTVFELASGGIALLDANLAFIDVNPAFCRIAGQPRAQVIGADAIGILGPGLTDLIAGVMPGGHGEGILPVRRPDGTRVKVELRMVHEGGGGGALIALATDVTERLLTLEARERLLESERAARSEAERSNLLKDEFLATLSHELRNPLNAILGWARVLARTPDTTPAVAKALEAIERNAHVQAHLIEDLLDFASIRFGKMSLSFEPIDPRSMIRSALEVSAEPAERKGVRLRVTLDEEPVCVLADEARMQQVVWNLLSNAIKFSAAGGEVSIGGAISDGCYELSVSDTGHGISSEFLPHVFERFSQQDAGAGKRFKGLGIGLAIVKHVVEMHHGTVEARSEGPGRGASFIVRLPLAEVRPAGDPNIWQPRLEGVCVLVVDDDVDARGLVLRILGDAGARLTQAAGADEAIAQIQAHAPDVLVSDVGMAERDGYQLVRAVRALGFGPERLPALALTAFARLQDRAEAIAAGFQVHLSKPVNAVRLVAAVAELARRRRPPSDVAHEAGEVSRDH